MSIFTQWRDSQVKAWQFVENAYNRGLSQTAALQQYRAGGGHIANNLWSQTWHAYDTAGQLWNELSYYSPNQVIPERLWASTPQSFSKKYVAKVTFRAYDPESQTSQTFTRWVESNTRMTQAQIQRGIEKSINLIKTTQAYDEYEENFQLEFVYGIQTYKRGI